MNAIDELLGVVTGAPSLPGARCAGRAHLFDPAEPTEPASTAQARHRQAVGLCQRCPSLIRCRDWIDTLPARDRPPGVVAATLGR